MVAKVCQKQRIRGFTLIELSVVLVIIGMLVGGILVGQSLIRQSQINSARTDVQRFITAAQAFQAKYNALPGDMANATSYWGSAGGNSGDNYTASCSATVGTGTATCNGDGNGQIGTYGTSASYYEWYRAWQHLNNGGYIEGSYSGTPIASTSGGSTVGTNVPASKVSSGGFTLVFLGLTTADGADFFAATYNHVLFFGSGNATLFSGSALLTPSEALALDRKYDDGLPGSGSVMALASTSSITPGCTTTAVHTTAAYAVASSNQLCSLIFISGF